jgi:hypothetical protein
LAQAVTHQTHFAWPVRADHTFFQDRFLFTQRLYFAPKSTKLLAFIARHTVGSHAVISIRLRHPIPDRLRGRLELLR